MAKTIVGVRFFMFSFSLFTIMFIGRSSPFLENKVVGADSEVSKLHFYVQDIAGGADRTVYEVTRSSATVKSPSRFNHVKVVDHKITAGPDRGSTELGRLRETIASDVAVLAFTVNLNFHFTAGEYNGSTVRVVGWVEVDDPPLELPVVDGTGLFHSATEYALTSTYFYDVFTKYIIHEYTLYVRSGLQDIARDFQ